MTEPPTRLRTSAAPADDSSHEPAESRPVAKPRGAPVLVTLFVVSLLIPSVLTIGSLTLPPHRLLLLLLIVPLTLMLLGGRAGPLTRVDGLIAASTVWTALSLAVTARGEPFIEAIGLHTLEFLGAYVLARVAIRSSDDVRRFVRFMFYCIVLLAPFAAWESLTGRALLIEAFPATQPPVETGDRWGLRRVQTSFVHPIHYGIFVSACVGMIWFSMRPVAGMFFRIFSTALVFFATFFSLSIGALICFFTQLVLITWDVIMRRNPRRWTLFGWLALSTYVTLDLLSNRTPFHLLVDYASFNSGSAYNRILIWRFGTDNVLENPMFGLGVFIEDWERAPWMSPSLDNFWLFMTVKFGLPTLIFLVAGVAVLARRVGRARLADPVDRACRTGYLITLAGVCVAGGTVHYWGELMAFMMFLLGAGMWMVTGGGVLEEHDAMRSGRRTRTSRKQSPMKTRAAN